MLRIVKRLAKRVLRPIRGYRLRRRRVRELSNRLKEIDEEIRMLVHDARFAAGWKRERDSQTTPQHAVNVFASWAEEDLKRYAPKIRGLAHERSSIEAELTKLQPKSK